METSAFEQAATEVELNQDKNQSETNGIKDKAKSFGKGLKDFVGKGCDIAGTLGMQAMIIVALWVVGAILIDAMGMGLGLGLLAGFLGAFFLSYLGNGMANGQWNPIKHFEYKLV